MYKSSQWGLFPEHAQDSQNRSYWTQDLCEYGRQISCLPLAFAECLTNGPFVIEPENVKRAFLPHLVVVHATESVSTHILLVTSQIPSVEESVVESFSITDGKMLIIACIWFTVGLPNVSLAHRQSFLKND